MEEGPHYKLHGISIGNHVGPPERQFSSSGLVSQSRSSDIHSQKSAARRTFRAVFTAIGFSWLFPRRPAAPRGSPGLGGRRGSKTWGVDQRSVIGMTMGEHHGEKQMRDHTMLLARMVKLGARKIDRSPCHKVTQHSRDTGPT